MNAMANKRGTAALASQPGSRKAVRLPRRLRPLFWDQAFDRLKWPADQDMIIARVLAAGDWEAIQWLRRLLGQQALRKWLLRQGGAGLSARQLRFWQLILELPAREVDSWLGDPRRQVWERRRQP
jgi:hypothetical protein